MDHTMILLSFAFAAAWTVTSAMAAHLPRIVEAFGATPAQAVFGMMIGPAQVAARVLEASTLSRFHPLFSTRLACITHPIGACVIGVFGRGAAAAFAPAARRRQRHTDDRAGERYRWRSSARRTTPTGWASSEHLRGSPRRWRRSDSDC
jgi:hypothetical protein